MNLEELQVIHNPAENRFEVTIDGLLSKLDYIENGGTIIMTHVGVHPQHRGGGVAGRITQTALEYAKEKSMRVVPMCYYVAAYIRRNPQYAGLTQSRD